MKTQEEAFKECLRKMAHLTFSGSGLNQSLNRSRFAFTSGIDYAVERVRGLDWYVIAHDFAMVEIEYEKHPFARDGRILRDLIIAELTKEDKG
jgi:hypothetical protein